MRRDRPATRSRGYGWPRLALHARVITYAGLSTVLLGFAGALAVYQQEHAAPDATMRTFGDAVWWTCATLSTVGMMACGLALLGAVTGSFSSWLLQVFAYEGEARPPES